MGRAVLKRGRRRTPSNSYDVSVGTRIRHKRTLIGMSQMKLGALIGRSYQQVQKYETGLNRVSGELLPRLAVALSEPVAYFTGEVPASMVSPPGVDTHRVREAGQMARAFSTIEDPKVRKGLRHLVNVLSKVANDDET